MRELEKRDGSSLLTRKIILNASPIGFGHRVVDFDTGHVAEEVVTKRANFDARLAEALADGFTETERSLSRRVLVHSGSKFWIVFLDGAALRLQFGGVRVNWRESSGQTQTKDFPSREEALAAYHKAIAEKKKGGYREQFNRVTPFSMAPTRRGKKAP